MRCGGAEGQVARQTRAGDLGKNAGDLRPFRALLASGRAVQLTTGLLSPCDIRLPPFQPSCALQGFPMPLPPPLTPCHALAHVSPGRPPASLRPRPSRLLPGCCSAEPAGCCEQPQEPAAAGRRQPLPRPHPPRYGVRCRWRAPLRACCPRECPQRQSCCGCCGCPCCRLWAVAAKWCGWRSLCWGRRRRYRPPAGWSCCHVGLEPPGCRC